MNKNTKKILTKESIETCAFELRKYWFSELTLLKAAVKCIREEKSKKVLILLASSCTTGTAIYELGEKPEYFYTEIMMLSRSFIEKIVNFCYVLVADEDEYERFLLHPFYRMYHNFNRSKFAGDIGVSIKYSGQSDIKKIPHIQKALSKFSETNPKQNWSSKSIDQKISILKQKTKIKVTLFLINTLSIYSNASESLHGSMYGASYHLGAYEPSINPSNKLQVEVNLLKNLALIYIQLGSMIDEVLKFLSKNNNELSEIVEASDKNQKTSIKVMEVLFGN